MYFILLSKHVLSNLYCNKTISLQESKLSESESDEKLLFPNMNLQSHIYMHVVNWTNHTSKKQFKNKSHQEMDKCACIHSPITRNVLYVVL